MKVLKVLLFSKLLRSFICGVLFAFSLPPFSLPFLAVISLALFYYFIKNCSTHIEAFKVGYLYGLGYFIAGIYWIVFPLWEKNFLWLIPFALIFIPALLAFHFSVSSWLFFHSPFLDLFTFSALLTFFEWVRGHFLLNFPWNLIGYSFNSLSIIQITSIVGIYGLTFIIIFFSGSLAFLLQQRDKPVNYLPLVISIISFLIIESWGYKRVYYSSYKYIDVKLRLVQANIPRPLKWDRNYAIKVLNTYLNLTLKTGFDKIDCIIWPETALPFLIPEYSNSFFKQVYSTHNKYYIIGGDRENKDKISNSIFLIGKKGELLDLYDKQNLVPFGEYIPLKQLIRLEKFVYGIKDFSPGIIKEKVFNIPSLFKASPTICYEDIFPNFVTKKPVDAIINVTNDSWFGNSSAPYQHFQMARVRSIEEGLPVIRATSTGISGIIDAYGRVQSYLPLNTRGIIDGFLPQSLPYTFYRKFSYYINLLIVVIGGILTLISLLNFYRYLNLNQKLH